VSACQPRGVARGVHEHPVRRVSARLAAALTRRPSRHDTAAVSVTTIRLAPGLVAGPPREHRDPNVTAEGRSGKVFGKDALVTLAGRGLAENLAKDRIGP